MAPADGIDSWPKFKHEIESAGNRVPATVSKAAETAIVAGDVATLEGILHDYGDVMRNQRPQSWWNNTLAPDYDAGDARAMIARTHHFETFEDFVAFTQAIVDKSAVIDSLLAAGACIEPGMTEWWKKEASSAPTYARILELLGNHGCGLSDRTIVK